MKTTIKNSWNAVKGGVNKTVEAVKKPVKIILYSTLGLGVVGTAGAATDINYNNGEITKTTLKRSRVDNKTIDDVVATLDRSTGDAKLPTKNTGVTTEVVYTEPEDNPTTPDTITEDDDDTILENSEKMDDNPDIKKINDFTAKFIASTNIQELRNFAGRCQEVATKIVSMPEGRARNIKINTLKGNIEIYGKNIRGKSGADKLVEGTIKIADFYGEVFDVEIESPTLTDEQVAEAEKANDPNSLANLKKNPTFVKNLPYGVKMFRANAAGIVSKKLLAGQKVSDNDQTASLMNTYIGLINGSVFSHENKKTVVYDYHNVTSYDEKKIDPEFDRLMAWIQNKFETGDLSKIDVPRFVSKADQAEFSDVDF